MKDRDFEESDEEMGRLWRKRSNSTETSEISGSSSEEDDPVETGGKRKNKKDSEAVKEIKKNGDLIISEENKETGNEKEEREINENMEMIEGNIGDIKEELGVIFNTVSRETNKKVLFNKGDQNMVKSAVMRVQGICLDFLVRQMKLQEENGRLRRENEDLKRKLEKLRRERNTEERGPTLRDRKDREKVEVSGSRNLGENIGNLSSGESEENERGTYAQKVRETRKGWSTPVPNLELIVVKEDEYNAGKLAKELGRKVRIEDMGGMPKDVRILKDGKVGIIANNEEHREKIRKELEKLEGVDVRNAKCTNPMILITGVSAGVDEEELMEILKEEIGELTDGNMKVIKKRKCRNVWKNNWVLGMGGEEFRKIIKKGKINVGRDRVFVEEYVDVAMCYKCCRYGHIAKWCKDKAACYDCGGDHQAEDCGSGDRGCVNCARVTGRKERHGARDPSCPVLRRNVETKRKYVKYRE